MFKRVFKQVSLSLALGAAAFTAQAVDITGAGASFPYPVYAKWASDYKAASGNAVNYQSIGSGGGQQQIIAKTVDFGASDDPLKADALEKNGLLQFPAVIGGTVPVVNIEGVKPGQLKLSGAVLADIFLGKITKWNDGAIAAMNDGVKLPNADIVVVHRSDGSGTTFGWTNYLSKVSPEWKEKVGEGKAVKWPVGQGGKGNEGVAAYVRQLKGSIGYVELAYAEQNNMSYASLQNAAGQFVQPTPESFAAAAASADWANTKDFNLVITNAPGETAWPITATNFILVYKQPKDAAKAKHTLDFFKWAYEQGQAQANELDYVPLPPELVGQIEQYWSTEIKL